MHPAAAAVVRADAARGRGANPACPACPAGSALHTLEYAGINIKRWLHGFDSVVESVANRCGVGGFGSALEEYSPMGVGVTVALGLLR